MKERLEMQECNERKKDQKCRNVMKEGLETQECNERKIRNVGM